MNVLTKYYTSIRGKFIILEDLESVFCGDCERLGHQTGCYCLSMYESNAMRQNDKDKF